MRKLATDTSAAPGSTPRACGLASDGAERERGTPLSLPWPGGDALRGAWVGGVAPGVSNPKIQNHADRVQSGALPPPGGAP